MPTTMVETGVISATARRDISFDAHGVQRAFLHGMMLTSYSLSPTPADMRASMRSGLLIHCAKARPCRPAVLSRHAFQQHATAG